MNAPLTPAQIEDLGDSIVAWFGKNCKSPAGMPRVIVTIQDLPPLVLMANRTLSETDLDTLLASSLMKSPLFAFSQRTRNVLDCASILYVGQAARICKHKLLQRRNCGKKTFAEIKQALEKVGLSMEMTLPVGPIEKKINEEQPIGNIQTWIGCGIYDIVDLAHHGIKTIGDLSRLRKSEIESIMSLSRHPSAYPNDTPKERIDRLRKGLAIFGLAFEWQEDTSPQQ